MSLSAVQLQERESGIGSSDCAAALNCNPYKSRLELYLEKTGEVTPPDLSENERILWGNVLEDPIAREFARRRGVKVHRVNITQRHREHDFLVSHIDRKIVGMNRALEVKNVGHFYGYSAFGEEGTDAVPDVYLLQCHHQMIVNDLEAVELAALVGGNSLKLYEIHRDDELAAMIVDKLAEFWNHVTTRTPPPPETVHELELLYAEDNGAIKSVDASVAEIWLKYHEASTELDAAEAVVEDLKNKLRFAIAEAAGIQIDDELNGPDVAGIQYAGKPLATWKTQGTTRVDSARLKTERPDLYSEFSKTTRGRVLRIRKP